MKPGDRVVCNHLDGLSGTVLRENLLGTDGIAVRLDEGGCVAVFGDDIQSLKKSTETTASGTTKRTRSSTKKK